MQGFEQNPVAMKFLIFATVEVSNDQALIRFIEDLKWQLGGNLQVSFSKQDRVEQLAPEFYMPCPKDGVLTKMQTVGGQDKEVYQGTCENGHDLEFVDLDELDDDS